MPTWATEYSLVGLCCCARGGCMDPAVVPGRACVRDPRGSWTGFPLDKDTGAVQLDPITLTPDEAADGESWEEVRIVDTALPGIDARALGFMEARFESTDL